MGVDNKKYSTSDQIFNGVGRIKATHMNDKHTQELHKLKFSNVVPNNKLSCEGSHLAIVSTMDTGR